MRKLVTLRQIAEIVAIPGADAIEAVRVDGWWCVAKKNEFKVDDLGLYFEVDSFLPIEDERFAFLKGKESTFEEKQGYRIKTIRLRGQLSQGLLLPVDAFPEVLDAIDIPDGAGDCKALEDYDFSELLNVKKWERYLPAALQGRVKGNFPSFIPKTDQERCQNIPHLFEKYGDRKYEITYKFNGSSITVYWIHPNSRFYDPARAVDGADHSGICSRNLEIDKEDEDNAFVQAVDNSSVMSQLASYCAAQGRSLAVQGEMVGPGVQGNYEGYTNLSVFCYDIFDIDAQRYLTPTERLDLINDWMYLTHIPQHAVDARLNEFAIDLSNLLARAEGDSYNGNNTREGFVFKDMESDFSFKVISNRYLLKNDE